MSTTMNSDPAAPEVLTPETELDMLRQEVYDSMETVEQYRGGNTELIEVLMKVMGDKPDARVSALMLLTECGMVRQDGALNWPALAQRKDNRWTWEQLVRKFVKQPSEVDRLLNMDSAPSSDAAEAGNEGTT